MLAGGLDRLGIWPLLVLMAANSFLTQLHMAALDASFVMIVPKARLGRANGMMQTVWSVGDVLAPTIVVGFVALPKLLGGVDVLGPVGEAFARVNHGAALAVGFDALTFLGAAVVLSFLTIPSPERSARPAGEKGPKLLAEAKAGVAFIRGHRSLLSLLSIFTIANLASGPMFLLLPLLVRTNLSDSWDGLGLSYEGALVILTTAASVGGLVGGLAMTAWGGFQRRRFLGVLIPVLAIGAFQIAVGLSHLLYLTAAFLAIVTFCEPFVRAHAQAIWQSQTPPELQGRVYAVRTLVAGALIPFGSAVAGWAGGLYGPGVVVTLLGVLLAAFGFAQLFNGWLWRMDGELAASDEESEASSTRVTALVGD
jgi:MFS transporter, DHA3 family, macrolide efflux protein